MKERKSSKRGTPFQSGDHTLNPTPTSFGFEDLKTLNPTPVDFDPSEHDDLTRNPTPTNFNTDLSPVHDISKTAEPTYQPTYLPTTYKPTNLPTTRPTSTHSPTYEPTYKPSSFSPTYEPTTLAPVKTANTGLVPDMRKIIPSWDLNAGATWTVVILFFLVMFGVLILFVYNACFKVDEKRNKGDDEEITSNPILGEADPLLNTKPFFSPFGVPKESKTMARVSTVHTDALRDFFASGRVLDLHTSKGKKTVELSLAGTDIRWKTINDIFPKKFKLDVKSVINVEIGKKTQNFSKINVSDDLCLSLVSDKTTLDIEAKSQADRDIMLNGFSEMVENIKSKGPSRV